MEKRIIAHFMHEHEMAAALEMMPEGEATGSYVLGEIDEADIPRLREQGLVIQVLDPDEGPAAPSREIRGISVGRPRPRPRGLDIAALPSGPAIYLVELEGPLMPRWRERMEDLGVRFLEHIPPNGYSAKLSLQQVPDVSRLSFVKGVRVYDGDDTELEEQPRRRAKGVGAVPGSAGARMLTYDVRLHPGEELQPVLTWLAEKGVDVAGSGRGKIRLYLLEGAAIKSQLRDLPAVAQIEPFVPPRLLNDVARKLIGIDDGATTGPSAISQTGAGQIIAVADTGIDDSHPDFAGRIERKIPLGRDGDWSDPHGHGTHVAGSVLGDGSASDSRVRGTAPEARLVFQSLLDHGGGLGGLPLNLYDLLEEAYQAGARIHNNSWGAATESKYTLNSIEVDEFVAERRDMLVVIAAGNEGTASNNRNAAQGFVDWLSIDSPASSKNALTVGASRSARAGVGLANLTYAQAFGGASFPEAPIAKEKVSGDAEKMAAFSSRGPCDDRRIKPDLVAPGTDILSTKSSLAPIRKFWGPHDDHYAYMGGTSMATPIVSGCAALVRQFFLDEREHSPSAALLKATLINSTRWLTGEDAVADHPQNPNYHQGFGCIHMPSAIPHLGDPDLALLFSDTWEEGPKFDASGDRVRHQFAADGGYPLRLCLTWTDLPARALQNNLNLFLQHAESGQKWMGNADLPMSLNIPDPENNVEMIRIEDPQPGTYLVQISATNLLEGNQDYALVITGKTTGDLNPF